MRHAKPNRSSPPDIRFSSSLTSIVDDRLRSLAGHGGYAERPYEPADVQGAALVVAATDDDDVNAEVVRDAREARSSRLRRSRF